MPPFRTRIRAVRFKGGGEVRLLPSPHESDHKLCAQHLLADAAHYANSLYAGELAGVAMVVWNKERAYNVTAVVTDSSPFGANELPEFVKACLWRHINKIDTERVVKRLLNLPEKDG